MRNLINSTVSVRANISNTPVKVGGVSPVPRRIRVYSDRNILIEIGTDASADFDTSMPITERDDMFLAVPANAEISIITAPGETSGNVWITEF